jgi:Tfp pilus assembly protein PilN
MRAVNLLPQDGKKRLGSTGARRAPLIAVGAVAALGAMGYWGYSGHQNVDQARNDVAAATAERDALQTEFGAFQQAKALEAGQKLRAGAVVSLAAGRVNWERLVRDLSAVMPRQVWLTNLKGETDPVAATPVAATTALNNAAAPRGIHLDGFAFTQRQVALLMARAATVPGLGEPRLATSEVQDRADRTVIHFIIDIPIDQRAQDRPTLTPVSGASTAASNGATP